jgi:hypothetical protein
MEMTADRGKRFLLTITAAKCHQFPTKSWWAAEVILTMNGRTSVFFPFQWWFTGG